MTDETSPEQFRYTRGGDFTSIKGWGVDTDPKNDPTYPMKIRTDVEQEGYTWERPPLQPATVEILHSVERPNLTAVFGTAVPPRGLSGQIRREAYKYSESSYGRWMPLILADRVDVIEGLVDDLKSGTIPNIFAEMGMKADWKYNRKNFFIKTAATIGVAAGLALLLSRKKD